MDKKISEAPTPEKTFLDYEVIEIQVDASLMAEVDKLLAPIGLSPVGILEDFFKWFTNPLYRDDVVAWFLETKALLNKNTE